MGLVIAPILFVLAVLYVAFPLLKENLAPRRAATTGHARGVRSEKEDVLSSLRDIEMDYRMGKLSEEDYQNLKSEFEQRAVAVFRRLESLEKGGRSGKKNSKKS